MDSAKRTSRLDRVSAALVLGFSFGLIGCAESGIERPDDLPDWVIPAKPDATSATQGVTTWEVYQEHVDKDQANIRVLGVDTAGVPLTDTRLVRSAPDTEQETLVVESLSPVDGEARFDRDGNLVESTLTREDSKRIAGFVMSELSQLSDPKAEGKFDSGGRCDQDDNDCVDRCRCREKLCKRRCKHDDRFDRCDVDCKAYCRRDHDRKNSNGSSCDDDAEIIIIDNSRDDDDNHDNGRDDDDDDNDGCEGALGGFVNWFGDCVSHPISCLFVGGCKKKDNTCKVYSKHWRKCTRKGKRSYHE